MAGKIFGRGMCVELSATFSLGWGKTGIYILICIAGGGRCVLGFEISECNYY
jgi:hypothetical protein